MCAHCMALLRVQGDVEGSRPPVAGMCSLEQGPLLSLSQVAWLLHIQQVPTHQRLCCLN
jgi:hypothetical protein